MSCSGDGRGERAVCGRWRGKERWSREVWADMASMEARLCALEAAGSVVLRLSRARRAAAESGSMSGCGVGFRPMLVVEEATRARRGARCSGGNGNGNDSGGQD